MPPRLPTYDTPRPALRQPNRSLGGAQIRALIGTNLPDPSNDHKVTLLGIRLRIGHARS